MLRKPARSVLGADVPGAGHAAAWRGRRRGDGGSWPWRGSSPGPCWPPCRRRWSPASSTPRLGAGRREQRDAGRSPSTRPTRDNLAAAHAQQLNDPQNNSGNHGHRPGGRLDRRRARPGAASSAGALSDPSGPGQRARLAQITDPSVAFDRDGRSTSWRRAHRRQHRGAIDLNKSAFRAAGSSSLADHRPGALPVGPGPGLQPVVAVDNDLTPSPTRPRADGPLRPERANGFAGNVYVAWDTVDAHPTASQQLQPQHDQAGRLVRRRPASAPGVSSTTAATAATSGTRRPGWPSASRPAPPRRRRGGPRRPGDGRLGRLRQPSDAPCRATPIRVDRVQRGLGRADFLGVNRRTDRRRRSPGQRHPRPARRRSSRSAVDFPAAAEFAHHRPDHRPGRRRSASTHPAVDELLVRLVPPPTRPGDRSPCSTAGPTPPASSSATSAPPAPTWAARPPRAVPGHDLRRRGVPVDHQQRRRRRLHRPLPAAPPPGPRTQPCAAFCTSADRRPTEGTWNWRSPTPRRGDPATLRSSRSTSPRLPPTARHRLHAADRQHRRPVTTCPRRRGHHRHRQLPQRGPGGHPDGHRPGADDRLGQHPGLVQPVPGAALRRLHRPLQRHRQPGRQHRHLPVFSDDGGLTWQSPHVELVRPGHAGQRRPRRRSRRLLRGDRRRRRHRRPAPVPAASWPSTSRPARSSSSYFDTRYDAARARVADTLTTSIDGGQTFSPQPPSPTRPTTAIDADHRPASSRSGRSPTTSRPATPAATPPSASATARAWPSSAAASTRPGRAT